MQIYVYVLEYAACVYFYCSYSDVLDAQTESLSSAFVEYIDGARQYLESDVDKDPQILLDIRFHFTQFIKHLIRSMPGELLHCYLIRSMPGVLLLSCLIRSMPGEFLLSCLIRSLPSEFLHAFLIACYW